MPPREIGRLDDLDAQLRQSRDGHGECHLRRVSGREFLDHLLERGGVEHGAPGPPLRARRHQGRAARIEPGADQLVAWDIRRRWPSR